MVRAALRIFGFKCSSPATSYQLRYAPTSLLQLAVLDTIQKLENNTYSRPATGLKILDAVTRLIVSRQPMAAAPVPVVARAEIEREIRKQYKKLNDDEYTKSP